MYFPPPYYSIIFGRLARNFSGHLYGFMVFLSIVGCTPESLQENATTDYEVSSLQEQLKGLPSIKGQERYLASPSVTAGDRVYAVGHQDGSFPDIGWHVEGEMGGIWCHPIKLLDGFTAHIATEDQRICLTKADAFINYPMATQRSYSLPNIGLEVQRLQFVPDQINGMMVEYTFENQTQSPIHFQFSFSGFTDLSPVWLAEQAGIRDGTDTLTYLESGDFLARDSQNEWFATWGAQQAPSEHSYRSACNFTRRGKGTVGTLTYSLEVAAKQTTTLQLFIAGSYTSEIEATETLQELKKHSDTLIRSKKERYQTIAETAKLTIPDTTLQQAFEWVKYNTDWLIREVPAIGRGLSAGIPDYPWWFGCDNTYALQGVLATGRPNLAKETLQLLHQLSENTNGNGRIIHEASTNGVVFNPGNLNETPHFAYMLWNYYEWTGDRAFLEALYPTVKQGLQWLLTTQDADGNYCPEGAGMMEIHGLDSEMIDVAVYTQQGLEAAAKMAEIFGENEWKMKYQQAADSIKLQINENWWVEEAGSFADFIADKAKALELVSGAIIRADTLQKPWAVAELQAVQKQMQALPSNAKQGFVVYHNWVVNTPMEMGIADSAKALRALDTGRKFVNPFGVFVTGIDRDESAGTDDSSFAEDMEIFSYVGAVMTLPTGVQAIAESNYGRPNQALDYLHRMVNSFSYALPGSMYEVSPDFGMMAQAWNIYALAKPIVHHFFGIRPEAWRAYIAIRPQMPDTWHNVSLENLPIAENAISIYKKAEENKEHYTIEQKDGNWQIEFILPYTAGMAVHVNDTPLKLMIEGTEVRIDLSGMQNDLTVTR